MESNLPEITTAFFIHLLPLPTEGRLPVSYIYNDFGRQAEPGKLRIFGGINKCEAVALVDLVWSRINGRDSRYMDLEPQKNQTQPENLTVIYNSTNAGNLSSKITHHHERNHPCLDFWETFCSPTSNSPTVKDPPRSEALHSTGPLQTRLTFLFTKFQLTKKKLLVLRNLSNPSVS